MLSVILMCFMFLEKKKKEVEKIFVWNEPELLWEENKYNVNILKLCPV